MNISTDPTISDTLYEATLRREALALWKKKDHRAIALFNELRRSLLAKKEAN